MGERRNPNCKVEFEQSNFDADVAKLLGINLGDAMLCAIAGKVPSIGNCDQMTHAIISRDEETYDWIVSRGSQLKLPIPQEMINEAIEHSSRSSRKRLLSDGISDADLARGSGTFSACCSKSKQVSLIMVGMVDIKNGFPAQEPRFVVGHGMAVDAETIPNRTGPTGRELIKSIKVHYNTDFYPCPDKPKP